MSTKFLLIPLVVWPLAACTSLSGLGGDARPSCKAPEGVACRSVSGVYVNSSPDSGTATGPTPNASTKHSPPSRAAVADNASPVLGALRSEPTVVRIWVAPYEDSDGDLVDQSWVYLQVDNGRWLVEHSRERIRQAFAPRVPPNASQPSPSNHPQPSSAANSKPAAPLGSVQPNTATRPTGVPAIVPRAVGGQP